MKEIDNGQIERYSETSGTLAGHREKGFIRCSGELFGDLIYELRNNPNSSYVTYMNDVIRDGYNPKYLSVLRISSTIGELSVRETLCGKILNFFEAPVTFDKFVTIDGKDYMLSVDFIGKDEEFETLIDLMIEQNNYNSADLADFDKVCLAKNVFRFDFLCDQSIDMIRTALKSVRENLGDCYNFEEMENEFIENYIYSYLIRRHLFADSDFFFNNVGVLVNKENKTFRMAPNFDLELSSMFMLNEKYLIDDISFVIQKYPHIASKFYEKLKYLTIPTENIFGERKSKFEELIEESVEGDNALKDKLTTKLKGNVLKAKEVAGDILSKNCMF